MELYKNHILRVDEMDISYVEHHGSVSPIIFLHGWGGSAESFFPLWDELLQESTFQKRRFIAIDFPGFGASPTPPEPWDVARYATCVAQFLEKMNLSTVDVVSHSFGGRVTLMLLTTYPHLFRKAFFLAPAGIRHEEKIQRVTTLATFLKRFFSLPGIRILFPFVRRIGYTIIGGHDYLEVSGVMKETFQRVTQQDLSPLLPQITHPVAIAFGKNDTYVPYTDGAYMQSHIPNAQLTIFDDGKHGIHKTHAHALRKKFLSFFESL